ncbi:MAG: hypothetical protein M1830_000724 [Pleopsidium flavum]|nr:MAG: hypothetical protein M1830_000724 [Pleopsidium flavum]
MLSRRCRERNAGVIPHLLSQHGTLLSGDQDTVDMSTAENWLMREELIERFRAGGAFDRLSNADLSYPLGIGGSPGVRDSLAALVNNHFNPSIVIDPSHIVIAAGASYALDALIEQICDPEDSVMIAAPYWSGLDISLSVHNQAKVLRVHVPLDEFFASSSIDYYEGALKDSSGPVKAVLVCNPHNPLGRCYSRHTLQALLDFCGRHNLHYISDEVYALSLHSRKSRGNKSPNFVSALSLTGRRDLVHVIYSLSKDFGCSGIRLLTDTVFLAVAPAVAPGVPPAVPPAAFMGAVITQQNDPIRLSIALSTHSQVSSFAGLLATCCILDEKETILFVQKNSRRLKRAYKMIQKFLIDRRIPFLPAEAGMFVFARFCSSDEPSSEQDFQQQMKKHGVVLASGTSYHMNQPGWFRISYALPPSVVAEGLLRIDKSLKVLNSGAFMDAKTPQLITQARKRRVVEEEAKNSVVENQAIRKRLRPEQDSSGK